MELECCALAMAARVRILPPRLPASSFRSEACLQPCMHMLHLVVGVTEPHMPCGGRTASDTNACHPGRRGVLE